MDFTEFGQDERLLSRRVRKQAGRFRFACGALG
jgi:hypothetical protein